jgi:hypothetical protein
MAHCITRWSLVSVILFLVGPAALAQTDTSPSEQQPPAQQPMPQLTVPAPATTQPFAGFRMDCGQDVQRLCYGVQPGEGRLIRCLLSHRGQLSPACMSRIAAARPASGAAPPSYRSTQSPGLSSAGPPTGQAAKETAMRASCGPDVQRFCAGVSRENGGVIQCLSSHRMELSPTCDAFLTETPARRAAQKSVPHSKTIPPAADNPAAAGAPPSAKTAVPAGAPAISQ